MAVLPELPDAVRPIVEAARAAVKAAAPHADEVVCAGKKPPSASMMWKLVRYVEGGETVATIGTFAKHASVYFARGAEIDDESGLLEGSGKKLRYVTLRAPADAKRAAVKAILRKAFALAAEPDA